MTGRGRRGVARVLVLALVGLVVVGCGLVSSSGTYRQARLPDGKTPLAGAEITIVAKTFTEHAILGKITATYLSAAGAEVTDMGGAPGASGRQLLLDGSADLGWDYTGTAWQVYHAQTEVVTDPHELWRRVAELESAEHDLVWLPPADFNNTYAFAAVRSTADRLNVTTLSEVLALPVDERTFCIDDEFFSRSDGFLRMLEAYGIAYDDPKGVPSRNVTRMDSGVVYQATASGQPCNFGMVYATDGRIDNLDLQVMQDDRGFFLPYNGAAIVARETLEQYPQLRELLGDISSRLTDEGLQELNGKVDIDGEEPADVAYEWLLSEGLVVPED